MHMRRHLSLSPPYLWCAFLLLSNLVIGALRDKTGDYTGALVLLAGMTAAAAVFGGMVMTIVMPMLIVKVMIMMMMAVGVA